MNEEGHDRSIRKFDGGSLFAVPRTQSIQFANHFRRSFVFNRHRWRAMREFQFIRAEGEHHVLFCLLDKDWAYRHAHFFVRRGERPIGMPPDRAIAYYKFGALLTFPNPSSDKEKRLIATPICCMGPSTDQLASEDRPCAVESLLEGFV